MLDDRMTRLVLRALPTLPRVLFEMVVGGIVVFLWCVFLVWATGMGHTIGWCGFWALEMHRWIGWLSLPITCLLSALDLHTPATVPVLWVYWIYYCFLFTLFCEGIRFFVKRRRRTEVRN